MPKLKWDQVGERRFETGVDRGVLYLMNNGTYNEGHAWNGLTTITESPSGAESSKQYADNIVYLNLVSAEEFGATIEAFTYPDAFEECDGTASLAAGVTIGQQNRRMFGLAYRTKVGNDVDGADHGYKIHLIYGATASPSERAYGTVNDSPEAMSLSWEVTTTPVEVPDFKPTALLTIDSTKVDATALADLENVLYGTVGGDPRLPLPYEVLGMFENTLTVVATQAPSYNATTDEVTIPNVTGVVYTVDGEQVSGTFVITETIVVEAVPADGYKFTETSDTDWTVTYS